MPDYGYRALSPWLREQFGEKVYKLALPGGTTCPNRDGTCGTRGCRFCSAGGSGEFAAAGDTPEAQLLSAKARVASKYRGGRFIAYFQSYTATYGPPTPMRERFFAFLRRPEIAALSIATRPDCLGPEVLDLLTALNREKPVWVELGLQTIHPATARYIRRGYPLEVFDRAAAELRLRGLLFIPHMILGLPGESREDMMATARYIGQSGAGGVKLQLLHILSDADLAADYRDGRITPLTREAYIARLEDCLRVLPPEIVIHRLTGDGDKRHLLAPLWSADKKQTLQAIHDAFVRDQLRQGEWL